MNRKPAFTSVLFMLVFVAVAQAAPVVQQFTYQGKLEKNGAPVSGDAEIWLSIHTEATGGTDLSNSQEMVNVKDGVFTTTYSLSADEINGEARFLQINVRFPAGVGDFTTLSPRQRINPSPYALHTLNGGGSGDISSVIAGTGLTGGGDEGEVTLTADSNYLQRRVTGTCAAGASIRAISNSGTVTCETNHTGSPVWSLNGSTAYYESGSVGIGTSLPTEMLVVDGNIRIAGNRSYMSDNGSLGFLNNLGDGSGGAQLSNIGSIDLILDSDNNDTGRSFRIMNNGADRSAASPLLILRENGNLGMGTEAPLGRLHIQSGTDVANSGGGFIQLGNPASTNIGFDNNEIQARNNGSASTLFLNVGGGDIHMITSNQGNVGIGSAAPSHRLDVNGAIRLRSNANTNLVFQGSSDDAFLDLIKSSSTTSSARITLDGYTDPSFHQADIRFLTRTNGEDLTERMTIKNNGRVGIGSSSPVSFLDVQGAGTTVGGVDHPSVAGRYAEVVSRFENTVSSEHTAISVDAPSGQDAVVYLAENGQGVWSIRNDRVGDIQTNSDNSFRLGYHLADVNEHAMIIDRQGSGGFSLHFYGGMSLEGEMSPDDDDAYNLGSSGRRWREVWSANPVLQSSDVRGKQDIEHVVDGLNKVMQLRPVTYHWKKRPEDPIQFGLIAQEVLSVVPEIVRIPEDADEFMAISYSQLIPILIDAVQSQQKQLEEQKQLIEGQQVLLGQILSAFPKLVVSHQPGTDTPP